MYFNVHFKTPFLGDCGRADLGKSYFKFFDKTVDLSHFFMLSNPEQY